MAGLLRVSGCCKKKKLIEAGEHFIKCAPPADDTAELEKELDEEGYSEEDKERVLSSAKKLSEKNTHPDFLVIKENWEAVLFFLSCRTQWRHSMNGITGLCYEGVIPMLKLHEKSNKKRKRLFEELQLIEHGAMQAIHELKRTTTNG